MKSVVTHLGAWAASSPPRLAAAAKLLARRAVSKVPGKMLLMVTPLAAVVRASSATKPVKPLRALDLRPQAVDGRFDGA